MESPLSNLDAVRKSGDAPTDALLLTSDKPIEGVGAHSLICCSISPVLRAALRPTSAFREGETRTVNLDYATSEVVEKMLSFACGGFGHDNQCMSGDDAMDLLSLADRLDFAALRSACESTLESILTSENADDILACTSACGSMDLAAKARKIVDQPETSDVVRKLMDKKRKLETSRNDLDDRKRDLESKIQKLDMETSDTSEKISFEMDKALKEASASQSKFQDSETADTAHEYPHKAGRKLVVLPHPWGGEGFISQLERNELEKKHGYGSNELVFDTIHAAVEAALPGDVLELEKGGAHGPLTEEVKISKSLQIIGADERIMVMAGSDERDDRLFFVTNGADVIFANISFGVYESLSGIEDCPFLLEVEGNSRIWLDKCEVSKFPWGGDSLLCVGEGCSAFVSRCNFLGGRASAIGVDLQAEEVIIKDCAITACSEGGIVYGVPFFEAGECGAIEAKCTRYTIREGDRDSFVSTLKLTVLDTTITNCFGPAVSYRTNCKVHSWSTESKNFQWPGMATILLKGNKISGNGLALPSDGIGSVPEGDIIFHNEHADYEQRRKPPSHR